MVNQDDGYRYDGFLNAVIGHGLRNRDPFTAYRFAQPGHNVMDYSELENLFTFNGIANKIIRTPAEEAVRTGFTLRDGDADIEENDDLKSVLEDIKWQEMFSTALCWDRLYGGGVILMMIDDGGSLDMPVNENAIRNIEKLEVFDAMDVNRNEGAYYQDPSDPNYGTPEYFDIVGYNGGSFRVHESRLLIFDGETVSNRRRRVQNGWGGRVFDKVGEDIQRYGVSLSLCNMALSRLSQGILKLSGMGDLLQTDFGEQQVHKRLQLIDMARHMMNTMALDTNDEYDQKNLTLNGVKDIVEKFEGALCAASDIPATILFGKSPEGQNATGHSDFENYYNMIGRIQNRKVKPSLSRLIDLISKSSECPVNLPDMYTIKFNELWNQSEKETAETANVNAQAREHEANAANTYVNLGALDPSEVRDKLDDGDEYTLDRSLDYVVDGSNSVENNRDGEVHGKMSRKSI